MFRQPALRRITGAPGATRSLRAQVPRRTLFSRRNERRRSGRPVENLNIQQLAKQAEDWHRQRRIFLWSGAIAGILSTIYTAYKLKLALEKHHKLDSNLPSTDPLASTNAADRKVVIHDEDGREIVPTGNSTVPTFPRTLDLPAFTAPMSSPSSDNSTDTAATPTITTPSGTTEYTLVGLGLRTVTFLGLQVYVVGYYVATADIAALQNALTKRINPIATTLVPDEREQLRAALLDPAEGERTWDELLAAGVPARSAFRVVPVRDTDFHHLRDGFVRAIQARATPGAATDDSFGEAVRQFRAVFNRGSVPKRKELLLVRDETGRLSIAYDGGAASKKKEGRPAGRQLIGVVEDERVSRALWLNYLAGKKVASEPARQNIVEGIMEFVERPVGTVASQVVPVVNSKA
ncbi:chalcone-flavanone isomerase-domain-containing protein [Corynascus similis CBS 632.67]